MRPVIIVGAGRSGTNLLRDVVSRFDGYATWPCDEINYIWRHGNRPMPTDEFSAAEARPEVIRYLHRAFAKQQSRAGGQTVVEKTCATSLRVAFVHTVFPDARFVYIVRDGRDVVASAMERWTAELDLRYLARKARFVPFVDLPYYAARYARSRLARLHDNDRALSTWGPRFAGMDEAVRMRTLAEVCSMQWLRCVQTTDDQLADIDPTAVHRLHFEDLVSQPEFEASRLSDFLGARLGSDGLPPIKAQRIGRWRTALSTSDQVAVQPLLRSTLVAHNFPE